MVASRVQPRSVSARRQRGWLRNPFPSSARLIDRLVKRAIRAFDGPSIPRPRVAFEPLEPRILLSATALPDQQAIDVAEIIETVANDTPTPIVSLDPTGAVATVNPAHSAIAASSVKSERPSLAARRCASRMTS